MAEKTKTQTSKRKSSSEKRGEPVISKTEGRSPKPAQKKTQKQDLKPSAHKQEKKLKTAAPNRPSKAAPSESKASKRTSPKVQASEVKTPAKAAPKKATQAAKSAPQKEKEFKKATPNAQRRKSEPQTAELNALEPAKVAVTSGTLFEDAEVLSDAQKFPKTESRTVKGAAVDLESLEKTAMNQDEQDLLISDNLELSESLLESQGQESSKPETIERDGRIVAADFGILNLHEGVKQALKRVNYVKPTEVQALCLPYTLEGKDVAGFAQTGTGKTAVFLITAAHRILTEELQSGDKGKPAVLVLVPTRELAAQIESEAAALFADLKINTMAIFGGSSDIDKQAKALSKKVDLVIATPGRLFDLQRQGLIGFENVGLLVCDEADRMLDMGFIDDVEKVLSMISEKSQKMLFSATGSEKVHELAFEYLNAPEYIETTPEQITPERITQWSYAARAEEKFPVLLSLIRKERPKCAIVFTNTKVVAEWVGFKLASNGVVAEVLTGDIPQNRRMALIKQIKNGEVQVLVATDVLSRGLHVPGLSHVFNFDVPDEAESFIHRIGRTARAGEKGNAITLICEDYGYNMGAVQDLLGFQIPLRPIPKEFLAVEDKSEFPFDSTGRVKTIRDLRADEARKAGAVATGTAPEPSSPMASGEVRRGPKDPGVGYGAQETRSREQFPEGPRDKHAERGDVSRETPRAAHREGSRERPQHSASFTKQPVVGATAATGEKAREPGVQREFTTHRENTTPRDTSTERSRDTSTERSRDTSTERSRESKFVRRDERAKEVIESALLAAARERELLRSAALKSSELSPTKLFDAENAKETAAKIGRGLVRTIRRAAPGLGSFFKKLGALLEEEKEESVVKRAEEAPRPQTSPQAPRPRREDSRDRRMQGFQPGSQNRSEGVSDLRAGKQEHEARKFRSSSNVTFESENRDEDERVGEVVLERNGRPLREDSPAASAPSPSGQSSDQAGNAQRSGPGPLNGGHRNFDRHGHSRPHHKRNFDKRRRDERF